MSVREYKSCARNRNIAFPLILLVGVVFLCCTPSAQATLFDWNQSYGTWTAGAPAIGTSVSQSYDNDPANPGNDITITIANLNTSSDNFQWNGGHPKVDNMLTGGVSNSNLSLNLADDKGNAHGIQVTIQFNYTGGVNNVSFQLFGVDAHTGSYVDQISQITALTTTGATIGATSVTGSIDNQVTGSGTSFLVTGTATSANNSANGNATINFGSSYVTSVTFTYTNNVPSGAQNIALGNISYTPTPEVGSSLAAMGLCGAIIGFRELLKRRRWV